MPERGMGRVYQPTRQCLHCKGAGCDGCNQTGRRQIDTWCIQFSHRGRQYRESSGSTRQADAVALLKKRMAEAGAGKRVLGPAVERTTFEDLMELIRNDFAINRRKSTRRLETSIARLADFFAHARAVDITSDRIQRYVCERTDAGRELSTIRNETNTQRRAFRIAQKLGKVGDVPHFPKLEVNNVRTGFFEAPEIRKVLAQLPAPVAAVVEFAYLSGWRLGEILPLRWTQVDMDRGVIRLEVGSTRNSEGRTLPFKVLPALQELMQRQLAYKETVERERQCVVPAVFHRNGRPVKELRHIWAIACEKAGCSGRLFHGLRRTAVRNLERAGVPRSIAMKITGHKTESVYRRYAIVNEADIADGLGRLRASSRAGPRADGPSQRRRPGREQLQHITGR